MPFNDGHGRRASVSNVSITQLYRLHRNVKSGSNSRTV